MELKDYFDFNSEIDIRIKGHRISIQHVLNRYRQGKGVDELRLRFPTLSMEEIYATILYYLTNKEEVEAYLEREKLMDEEAGKLIYDISHPLFGIPKRTNHCRNRDRKDEPEGASEQSDNLRGHNTDAQQLWRW